MLPELRNSTRAQHESLEQKLDNLDPQFSRERYSWLLRRFYGFYGPIKSMCRLMVTSRPTG
jgi:heme oxygenase